MFRITILITALFLLPWFARSDEKADEKQAMALAEGFGATAGVFCFDAYSALSDLEKIAANSPKGTVSKEQVTRHIKALGVLAKYTEKLRPLFSDDKLFTEITDKLSATGRALKEQADALNAYLDSGSADDLKKAHEKKEAARRLLCPLLSLPQDVSREAIP
jgi:hypothetical protein